MIGRAIAAMAEINISSNQVADIVGVIDEIAFQTNLPAPNASVEAVRAVDQGRADIAQVSQEQANGIDQVNTNMDDLTQQNSALAEQVSAASSAMNDQTATMNKQIRFLKPANLYQHNQDLIGIRRQPMLIKILVMR